MRSGGDSDHRMKIAEKDTQTTATGIARYGRRSMRPASSAPLSPWRARHGCAGSFGGGPRPPRLRTTSSPTTAATARRTMTTITRTREKHDWHRYDVRTSSLVLWLFELYVSRLTQFPVASE